MRAQFTALRYFALDGTAPPPATRNSPAGTSSGDHADEQLRQIVTLAVYQSRTDRQIPVVALTASG